MWKKYGEDNNNFQCLTYFLFRCKRSLAFIVDLRRRFSHQLFRCSRYSLCCWWWWWFSQLRETVWWLRRLNQCELWELESQSQSTSQFIQSREFCLPFFSSRLIVISPIYTQQAESSRACSNSRDALIGRVTLALSTPYTHVPLSVFTQLNSMNLVSRNDTLKKKFSVFFLLYFGQCCCFSLRLRCGRFNTLDESCTHASCVVRAFLMRAVWYTFFLPFVRNKHS